MSADSSLLTYFDLYEQALRPRLAFSLCPHLIFIYCLCFPVVFASGSMLYIFLTLSLVIFRLLLVALPSVLYTDLFGVVHKGRLQRVEGIWSNADTWGQRAEGK